MSNATVIYNEHVGGPFFRMALRWKGRGFRPGQFVMVRVSGALDPLLRRPFGIYDVLGGRKGIEILYKVVGRGTGMLSELDPGDRVDVLGPLGNGFPMVRDPENLVMVAGGIGVAPFFWLAKAIAGKGRRPVLLYGARTKEEVRLVRPFRAAGVRVRVTTEDGSVGSRGLVTDLLDRELVEGRTVYACGPLGMLMAVSEAARRRGVKCLVSLERAMACGIGVCLGCAVKTRPHPQEQKHYSMVCSDGPVFASEEIDWDSF